MDAPHAIPGPLGALAPMPTMADAEHSKYSASGFEAARLCPGSTVLAAGAPRAASKYSAEGTVAHALLEAALHDPPAPPRERLGEVVQQDGFTILVDDEMVECVEHVAATMREMAGPDPIYFAAEQRVGYGAWLSAGALLEVTDADAFGTLDHANIPAVAPELQVHDLKYGRGVVVDPDGDQLKLYALGVIDQARMFADIDRVRLVIHQPRIKRAPTEHVMTVAELEAWAATVAKPAAVSRAAAAKNFREGDKAWEDAFLRPGDKQCKFCPAKGKCPKAREQVIDMVWRAKPATSDEFADVTNIDAADVPSMLPNDWLAAVLRKLDFIEDWCTAVRAEGLRRARAGETVPGFKLVQGRQGNRAWKDAAAAEAALKAMRLTKDQMYEHKLISPTAAEKLAPKYAKDGTLKPGPDTPIGDRQWKKLQGHITRADGALHLAPDSDDRPAVSMQPVAELFDELASPAGAALVGMQPEPDLSALI